jgi:hypothetical protein
MLPSQLTCHWRTETHEFEFRCVDSHQFTGIYHYAVIIMREEFRVAKMALKFESRKLKLKSVPNLQCYFTPYQWGQFYSILTLNWCWYSLAILKLFWSRIHYRFLDGILTVVRDCPETQLDYSNYLLVYYEWFSILLPKEMFRRMQIIITIKLFQRNVISLIVH